MLARSAVLLLAMGLALPARAQSLVTPASVGKAGATLVSLDDPTALTTAPAGLARLGGHQLMIGTLWSDGHASYGSTETFGAQAASGASDGAPVRALPALAASYALGQRVVLGVAWRHLELAELSWPRPPAAFDPATDDRAQQPGRYASLGSVRREHELALGGAVRLLPSLALGAAGTLGRVTLGERRMVWGGLGAVERVPELSPAYDLELATSLTAWRPGLVLSALWAPLDAPLELAVAFRWSAGADATGDVTLSDSRGSGGNGPLVRAVLDHPAARARLEPGWSLAAGSRFVGSRWSLEVDGELGGGGQPGSFALAGVGLAHESGPMALITRLQPAGTAGEHFALRTAADVDLVEGFLGVGAGYAYESGQLPDSAASPAWLDLSRHVLGVAVSARVEGVSIDLGVAFSLAARASAAPGELEVLAPLASGHVPAARGRLETSRTVLGVAVRASF